LLINFMRVYAFLLAGVCVLFFLAQIAVPGFTESFVLNQRSFIEPWRFVTSIFLHGSIPHLLYNMFALVLFGIILENTIGSRRFLFVFFFTGVGANLISVNIYYASLGASGAIFGIIGALTFIRPLTPIWAFGLPMPLFLASIFWVIGDILMTFMPTNIGTIAHLSGLFIGLIMGSFYRSKFTRKNKNKNQLVSQKDIDEWERRYMQ
jgi:membrane associated rhomboid family serine protease